MSLTSWKVEGKGEFISTDCRIRCHLQAGWWSRKVNSSAQITLGELDITYYLEGEWQWQMCQHKLHGENGTSLTIWKVKKKGEFVSTDHMGRIRHHLLPRRWRERWICQHRSHEENQTSLTLWKVKQKGEFVSANHMGRTRHHLLPGRLRRRWVPQPRAHENQTSLTSWKVKGEGEFVSTDRMENWTSLTLWKLKGKGEFVNTDPMERIRRHLLPKRWREEINLSAQIAWVNQVSLTNWKMKGKGEFLSACCMGRIRRHLHARRWRERVDPQHRSWRESDVTY